MVLVNKLGIQTPAELSVAEEKIGKVRARELFDLGHLAHVEVGTFNGLSSIHKYLFGDIYSFAGELRTVDIAKGLVRFTPVTELKTALDFVSIMPLNGFEDIINKFIQMYKTHPFRTGNGIAMRIWLNVMLNAVMGVVVDYGAIPDEAYLAAVRASVVDAGQLASLLGSAVVRDGSREMYLRGIDASFAYDGYRMFSAAEL